MKFVLNTPPVVWLVNSSVVVNIGHLLQLAAPLGEKVSEKNFISSRDGPTKKVRNKAEMRKLKDTTYYGMMVASSLASKEA